MAGVQSSIRHAELVLFDAGKGKTPSLGSRKGSIPLDFNPKEITWARSANWDGGKQSKKPQVPEYKGPAPGTIAFEAFLSAPATTDVEKAVLQLFGCVEPEKATAQDNPRPPFVQLAWGSFHTGISVMKSVSAKITLFDAQGKPSRATVQLQLQEVPLDPPKTNPTSGGVAGRRVHVVVEGDTLQSIAYQELDDPNRWRDIAVANRIDDPTRIRPGHRLMIPVPSDQPVGVT